MISSNFVYRSWWISGFVYGVVSMGIIMSLVLLACLKGWL